MSYTIVLLQEKEVKVPVGRFCWNWWNGAICDHFIHDDSTSCGLGLGTIEKDERQGHTSGGYLKPDACLVLPLPTE